MAAESVTILKTEPGSYSEATARFTRASGGLSPGALGLNVGQLAMARISPFEGSCTITVPAFACVCSMAAANSFSAMN